MHFSILSLACSNMVQKEIRRISYGLLLAEKKLTLFGTGNNALEQIVIGDIIHDNHIQFNI